MQGKGAMRFVLADLFEDEVQARSLLEMTKRIRDQLERLVLPNLERVQAGALRRLLDSGGGVPLPQGSAVALKRLATRLSVSSEALGWAVTLHARLGAKLNGNVAVRDKEALIERFRGWCGSSTTRATGLLGTAFWDPFEPIPFLMDARPERTDAAKEAAFRLLASTREQARQLMRHADAQGFLKDLGWWLENRTLLVGGERFFLVWNLHRRGVLRPINPESPLLLGGEWRLVLKGAGSRAPDRRVLLPHEWNLVDELNS